MTKKFGEKKFLGLITTAVKSADMQNGVERTGSRTRTKVRDINFRRKFFALKLPAVNLAKAKILQGPKDFFILYKI